MIQWCRVTTWSIFGGQDKSKLGQNLTTHSVSCSFWSLSFLEFFPCSRHHTKYSQVDRTVNRMKSAQNNTVWLCWSLCLENRRQYSRTRGDCDQLHLSHLLILVAVMMLCCLANSAHSYDKSVTPTPLPTTTHSRCTQTNNSTLVIFVKSPSSTDPDNDTTCGLSLETACTSLLAASESDWYRSTNATTVVIGLVGDRRQNCSISLGSCGTIFLITDFTSRSLQHLCLKSFSNLGCSDAKLVHNIDNVCKPSMGDLRPALMFTHTRFGHVPDQRFIEISFIHFSQNLRLSAVIASKYFSSFVMTHCIFSSKDIEISVDFESPFTRNDEVLIENCTFLGTRSRNIISVSHFDSNNLAVTLAGCTFIDIGGNRWVKPRFPLLKFTSSRAKTSHFNVLNTQFINIRPHTIVFITDGFRNIFFRNCNFSSNRALQSMDYLAGTITILVDPPEASVLLENCSFSNLAIQGVYIASQNRTIISLTTRNVTFAGLLGHKFAFAKVKCNLDNVLDYHE